MNLLIDAAATPLARAIALFPAEGEYARTIAALANGGALLALVPDRVVLSIYASELAERLREQARAAPAAGAVADDFTVHAPFWPELLFVAADELVHPAREIGRLWPKIHAVTFVERDLETLREVARRILGGERFDLERYRAGARDFANAGRFQRVVS